MLILPGRLAERLVGFAEEEPREEVCGVLAGSREGENRRVAKIFPCSNIHPSPYSNYEIEPAELLRVINEIEGSDLELLGFYHSHIVDLSHPSPTDEAMAQWPEHSYVIVSPWSARRITAWIWREKGFVEEEVVIR